METGFALDPSKLGKADPIQPDETEEMTSLKARARKELSVTPKIEQKYGGENRFYERFLLARDNDVEKALKLMKKCLSIRESLKVDAELSKQEQEAEEEVFSRIKPYWPLDFWGFGKDGSTILFGKLKNIKPKKFVDTFEVNEIKRFYVHFVHEGNELQKHSNSPSMRQTEEGKWKRQIEVFDLNGISTKQLHMKGLKILKEVLGLGQHLFPENVERTYMLNAPWFFSGAWNIVKHALDKETQKKVVISRYDCRKQLSELLGSEALFDEMMQSMDNH
mmetsp:Transcript_15607/g.17632  ORF Transcript_15607/g.17632 Transcript_15607/m.17632 type:complete len:277 (-) Transcript_15607:369-1199(-)